MRSKLSHLLCCSACLLIFPTQCLANPEKDSLSLDNIFASDEFSTELFSNIQWRANSKSFTFTEVNPKSGLLDIYEYQVSSGKTKKLLAGDELKFDGKPVHMSHYQWSAHRKYLLLRGPLKLTWDGQQEAAFYIYESDSRQVWPLAKSHGDLRNVRLSPDGEKLGYVRENNLYLLDLKQRSTTAVTSDGDTNIFNGVFDYGSTEFSSKDAWFWSPDSQKVAFWRLDASDVPEFYMVDELGKYNTVRAMKYPNTGERHALNQVGVYELASGMTTWMDIAGKAEDYIPRIKWSNSSRLLAIQHLTRDHEQLTLYLANTKTGKSKAVLRETDPAWIDVRDDMRFLQEENQFLWTSEKSGYRHAYLYDYQGKETVLTSGDWEISSVIGLDEKQGWLYFYAKKDSFIDQHVYRVNIAGGEVEKLSDRDGWYQWQFSPDYKKVVETYSNARTPKSMRLRKPTGELIAILKANKLSAMKDYAMSHTEFFKVKTGDGILIDAYMIKPSHFDPGKKYPAIGYGYGNAGSQVVINNWSPEWPSPKLSLWHRFMAEQGYIIFAFDNRTTAGRGKMAKNLTYGEYGKYAILDYLEGVEYLKKLSYIDASRVGFWGWSGGGYLAAALMTKGAPHFKTAISVAPVIDISRYQAVGVERWMGFLEDNPDGYYRTNLINYADKLQGNLLLIHGTGDENVKFGFTLQFADALIKAGKQFDMMVYPNQHHRIRDHQQHVFTKMTNYFLEKL